MKSQERVYITGIGWVVCKGNHYEIERVRR
ncbi:hypothetical protein SEA_JEEVES_101 [Mycobacterium phage Jeeves]|uniref:Uncharacterized protein n=1 Tax=Mycobacterium phage Jeeves TaxID=2652402 RepID=A0A5J6T2H9_9CAUD|nr:hypothetical protein KNU75_gp008 [Mycobacterium phage Jeeves]QFG04576.1 hypothetical protein SEA_JEEVES_101 [Mycobacterium phage Jeeves]